MKAGKLRAFLGKNLGLKLLALIFALFLWFFVVGEEKAEVSLNVPLELVNMPKDMLISNEFNGMIDVRVYGPRSLVRELATKRLSHVVDLANTKPGRMVLHITPESIRLPRGVQVTRIHPSQVALILEPLVRREVPVEAVLKGEVAADHKMKGVELEPANVVLVGAAREVAKVKKVLTHPIDVSGLDKSMNTMADIDLQMFHVKVEGAPPITAYIQVEENRIRNNLVVPVEGLGAVHGYKIDPVNIKVSLSGPVSIVRNVVQNKNIRAMVELEGLHPGIYMRQPVIQAPLGVKIEKTAPKSVRITVLKK